MKPNKTLQERTARLLPAGAPRYVRIYDNGGETADRYTACFTGRAAQSRTEKGKRIYSALGMSALPFHPQGFGQHTEATAGAHLGSQIGFDELPEDCRRFVMADYCATWGLPTPVAYLSAMVRAYLTAALWMEDEDTPSGQYESSGRIEAFWPCWAPESITKARDACNEFAGKLNGNGVSIRVLWENLGMTEIQAGHDLWLTRNGHGSGFWDRTGAKAVLDTLTDAAHALKGADLYQGDDGKLYFQ